MTRSQFNIFARSRRLGLALAFALISLATSGCILLDDDPTPFPTATSTPLPAPLPRAQLIENTRNFLKNTLHTFEVDVDAEGDGRISHNCLEVLEGGPDGFEWSVEQRADGQWLVRITHTASLVEKKTGTWLQIIGGGVGTTADSISCNDVPSKAYYRDNPAP